MKALASPLLPTLIGGALLSNAVLAGPADYVRAPKAEYGEREIEIHLGTQDDKTEGRETAAVVYYGTGLTPWWFTELGGEIEKVRGDSTKLEAIEWENYFKLTEPGQYAVDVAGFLEVEAGTQDEAGWALIIGPLFQTEFGRVQLNFNPLLERKFDTGNPQDTELNYQAQVKYRYRREFEFGLQAFGALGKWNDWENSDNQTHKLGPAIFGKLPLGGRQAVKYDFAVLFGLNDASPDTNVRATIEYEF